MEADGYTVKMNKTKAWIKHGCPLHDKDIRAFGVEHLNRHRLKLPGEGFIITVKPGKKNTKSKPYTFKTVKRGKTKNFVRSYLWRKDSTGEVLEIIHGGTKRDALIVGRKLVQELETNITLEVTYEMAKSVAGHMKFSPSTRASKGIYMFIGIERDALVD